MNEHKNGKVEILRFLAALMIMDGHMGILLGEEISRPFRLTWFYVEFFFLLTAILTAKHFDREESLSLPLEGRVKEALRYTGGKILRFLPYTVLPTVLMYLVVNANVWKDGFGAYLRAMENLPFELLFLSAGLKEGTVLFPIWFLSALLIALPLIAFLSQSRRRYTVAACGALAALLFFFSKYDYGSHVYPNQLLRALSAMLLGLAVYAAARWLSRRTLTRRARMALSALELLSALLPIALSIPNVLLLRVYLGCFVVFFAITFSGQSLLPNPAGRWVGLLGKLSLPMYVWHYLIGTVLHRTAHLPTAQMVLLYYGLTLLIAALNLLIVERVGRKRA